LVVIVMPAASVAFFRPEFDDFLYAAVGADRNEMPLSVLSALARLDVDPWKEASELSELPKATARLRLTSLIERLPGGRWAPADCGAIADRLIELLPRRGSFKTASAQESHDPCSDDPFRGHEGSDLCSVGVHRAVPCSKP
jgi:hypothetical protein